LSIGGRAKSKEAGPKKQDVAEFHRQSPKSEALLDEYLDTKFLKHRWLILAPTPKWVLGCFSVIPGK
jgi:hypothetical protein